MTFKTATVDAGEFLKAWDASFGWEMMRYPVLTRVRGQEQLYLQENKFQVRGVDALVRQELAPEEIYRRIHESFGIDPQIVARALTILKRAGKEGGG